MNGFRLARIFGIDVRVDYSWFIIVILILWSFTASVFPAQAPGLSQGTYIAMGVGGAVLFFVSLLLHELSHSVVARAKGIAVDGITLFIFGGMAHTKSEARTPGDEFLIAGVGPLASLLIAAALGGLVWVGVGAGWSPAVLVVAQYLAVLNVALAVFNLLPGFPLDGGRLFRAVVWKVTGSVTKATRVASVGGRLLGYALIALGVFEAVRGRVVSGLWLGFIGWFLRNAAIGSLRQHLVQDALQQVEARQVMTSPPVTVAADLDLQRLVGEFVTPQRFTAFPVVRNGEVVGLVSLNEVKRVPRERWPDTRASDVMVPADDAIVVGLFDPMNAVLEKLRASPLKRVLVLRNGELEGMITAHELAAWLERARRQPEES
ncbi:MAG: site-2 protease family protein [Longimicrobiales bacterium]